MLWDFGRQSGDPADQDMVDEILGNLQVGQSRDQKRIIPNEERAPSRPQPILWTTPGRPLFMSTSNCA